MSITTSLGLDYPGEVPGKFAILKQPDGLVLSNRALTAEWKIGRPGLKFERFGDIQEPRAVRVEGELFEIVLPDKSYPASALLVESGPQLKALAAQPRAARLSDQIAGNESELRLRSADGRLRVIWRAIGHDNANYLRQEIEITTLLTNSVLREIRWLNAPVPGARTEGQVDGSPVTAGTMFMGCEDPHARNLATPRDRVVGSDPWVSCAVEPNTPLRRGETLSSSFVFGVAPAGQLRRGFLYYLERERAHPYRPFLHYNSWYDIAWDPFALNETNCLEAIRLFGEGLIRPYDVVMDAMVFDDGWDDPHTLWQFHKGFPNGFSPLAALCKRYNTHLGVWLSPFGGYGESKSQRLKFGASQGYETNATGFSLAGPKYYAAFKGACVTMMKKYGVSHFKFDGIAAGMYANGGADYYRDTQAMRRLMRELKEIDPNIYINLTTGSWPSPFWLRYADSIWRQGDDMGFTGKGSRQQQWMTYRDREVYRNIVLKGPLFPLNSLMTQGVAYSRKGAAGDPTFNSAGFCEDVRAFFGSGTGLQELYIQPSKLSADDWKALAEAAKWSRANSDVLVDTHWIGGDPGRDQVYGYASWSPRRSIIMLRNPDDRPHEFSLEIGHILELPTAAPTTFHLKSPWVTRGDIQAISATTGTPVTLQLAQFQILLFEAIPES